MSKDWLWDRKINANEVKRILKSPQHKNFIMFASLLLGRKNDPGAVFKEYLNPLLFCKNWPRIKKAMRKDRWSSQRIIFWQAIYEKFKEKYRKKGIAFREANDKVVSELCKKVGNQIRKIRKEKGLSQGALAKRIGVSQQLISRIEKGRENISLNTLVNICKKLDSDVSITFL